MVSFLSKFHSRNFENGVVERKMETENHRKADKSIFGRNSRKKSDIPMHSNPIVRSCCTKWDNDSSREQAADFSALREALLSRARS